MTTSEKHISRRSFIGNVAKGVVGASMISPLVIAKEGYQEIKKTGI